MNKEQLSDLERTSREKFLNTLAENYLLQDAILNATELSVISADTDCTITSINRAAESLLGYPSEELVGKRKLTILHDESEIAQRARDLTEELGEPVSPGSESLVAKVKKTRTVDRREWTYIKKNGSRFPVMLSLTGIWNDEGRLFGYLGIATDISELQEQNRQLNDFVHIISHNLRSPVGNIGALVSLLDRESTLEDYKDIIGRLKLTANNLQETLNDLMETLKIKKEKHTERTQLSFEETFTKIKQDLAGDIIKSNAIVTYGFSACPEIHYPKTYLESILLNLLSNAIKYRSPHRTLKVHCETRIVDGRKMLRVSDNGLGIDLVRNGEKLFGLRKTFHAHPEARGVGLFLTKTQVEAQGGNIRAESVPDVGSKFIVTF